MAPRMRVRALVAAPALIAVLVCAAIALGALPQQSGSVDLATQANVRFDGAAAGNVFGESSAPAGDFNGDGFSDVIVTNQATNFAWVLFGRPDAGVTDLASPGSAATKIIGGSFNTVASAGDVNGDGLGDVVLGDDSAGVGGKAYVVFGSKTSGDVDLGALGARGFEFDGVTGDSAGAWVAGAGDLNKDGHDDVVIGAFGAGNNGNGSGSAYVVFGSASGSAVDGGSLGARGFRIDGVSVNDNAGSVVAGGGDVNGDGVPDVLVGAPGADNTTSGAGAAYVVFGKSTTTNVNLATLGAGGFRIDGAASDQLPRSAAIVGDMNGDGLADVAVGSDFAKNPTGTETSGGSVWVVFGKASTGSVTLNAQAATLGSAGFRIDNQQAGDQFGRSLGAAGDVNGDGIPDLVVGALFASNNGRSGSGSLYVIFGRSATTTIATSTLGSAGFRIDGALASDSLGRSANGAGDFNGDGRADVVGGAEFADPHSRNTAGSAYITYGFGPPSVAYSPTTIAGAVGTAITPLSPTIKRTGPASFAIAPALPAGLALDTATGVISGTPTAAAADAPYTVTMTDLAGSAMATVTIGVTAPATNSNPPPTGNPPPPTGACKVVKNGTAGADKLVGTAAGDLIHGRKGNDTLKGLAGDDCLFGDAGNDKLDGGAGKDKLSGGAGNDSLVGGKGKDTFDAGPGNDTINSADHVAEKVNCGKGGDKVKADKKDKLKGCEKVKRVR